jgi:hypothetical protein
MTETNSVLYSKQIVRINFRSRLKLVDRVSRVPVLGSSSSQEATWKTV